MCIGALFGTGRRPPRSVDWAAQDTTGLASNLDVLTGLLGASLHGTTPLCLLNDRVAVVERHVATMRSTVRTTCDLAKRPVADLRRSLATMTATLAAIDARSGELRQLLQDCREAGNARVDAFEATVEASLSESAAAVGESTTPQASRASAEAAAKAFAEQTASGYLTTALREKNALPRSSSSSTP